MPTTLSLTPDELLSTTRAVRKNLDYARPVPRAVLEECLNLAQQAPTGSNMQGWSFVVVTDPAKKKALAELYKKAMELYRTLPIAAPNLKFDDEKRNALQQRITSSAEYLAERLHEVPVHVIPCINGRLENGPTVMQASAYGSIIPAAWSFMLAARARGLGTCWTTLHLFHEEEAAKILGIPYAEVTQVALIPVAYTTKTDFKPGAREPLSKMVHWERW
jgi:nitroreductase